MASGGFGLNMLVLDFPRTDRCSDADWWFTVNAFEAALKANGAKGAVVASMGENLPESHAEELLRRGIVPILGIAEALDAAAAAAFVGEMWKRDSTSPLRGGSLGGAERGAVAPPVRDAAEVPSEATPSACFAGTSPSKGDEILPDEASAKAMLAAAGLSVPPGRRAAGVAEAVIAANELGYPVALKALGVAHKSEAGAVKLNLGDEASVRAAAEQLAGLGSGIYVERMIEGGIAELIVGITHDPLFGPVMTLGTGGVLVELLKDSATLLLPAARDEVEAALRGLKLFPLLDGFRGRPKADLASAIDAVLKISGFALANVDTLTELDVNPLIVCAEGKGGWAADALLVTRKTAPEA
jgi:acyl-CoA synthetase (NDP forming)